MRKDKKGYKTAEISRVGGYHNDESGHYLNSGYEHIGYKEPKYFTSDRAIKLVKDDFDRFVRADGKPMMGYGIEIESECWGINNPTILAEILSKVVFSHFPNDLFKLQRDGSLEGESSAECITQVMTKEAIRNNYASFKLMFDTYFPTFNISADRTGNCGMHVNISLGNFGVTPEAQAEAVRKLYYIVNHHYDFCCRLFYRNPRNTTYCERMHEGMDYCKTLRLTNRNTDHGVCFNLGHYDEGRVELRLVGGQKNFACFRNTMECVFFLVSRVCKLSWTDCDDLAKIFKGCNQYVLDRLSTYCKDAGTITDEQLAAIRPTVVRANYI